MGGGGRSPPPHKLRGLSGSRVRPRRPPEHYRCKLSGPQETSRSINPTITNYLETNAELKLTSHANAPALLPSKPQPQKLGATKFARVRPARPTIYVGSTCPPHPFDIFCRPGGLPVHYRYFVPYDPYQIELFPLLVQLQSVVRHELLQGLPESHAKLHFPEEKFSPPHCRSICFLSAFRTTSVALSVRA